SVVFPRRSAVRCSEPMGRRFRDCMPLVRVRPTLPRTGRATPAARNSARGRSSVDRRAGTRRWHARIERLCGRLVVKGFGNGSPEADSRRGRTAHRRTWAAHSAPRDRGGGWATQQLRGALPLRLTRRVVHGDCDATNGSPGEAPTRVARRVRTAHAARRGTGPVERVGPTDVPCSLRAGSHPLRAVPATGQGAYGDQPCPARPGTVADRSNDGRQAGQGVAYSAGTLRRADATQVDIDEYRAVRAVGGLGT